MNNQLGNRIPYVPQQRSREDELIEDAERAVIILGIFYLIHRAFTHHHVGALATLLISSVGAFLVMVNLDMTSDAAYFFWSLVLVAVVSLGKAISLHKLLVWSTLLAHALYLLAHSAGVCWCGSCYDAAS
jgi:hypothetical protein